MLARKLGCVAFLKFSLLRLGLVVLCILLFLWLGLGLWFSAILGVIVPWCITYLFFRNLRNDAAATLQRRFRDGAPPVRNKAELRDAEAEDSVDPNASVDMARKPRTSEKPADNTLDSPAAYRPDSYGPGAEH